MFKLGLVTGAAIGYVLGARAGRERYEQIREQYQKIKRSQPAQQLSDEVNRITDQASQRLQQKTQQGADTITSTTQQKI